MKKKGTTSLFALWDKAAKAKKKTNLASTPNPPVEIENNLQVALVQVQAHDDEAQAQSAVEANDEAPQSDRDIPTSIVRDDAATDEEGDIGADLEALEHDPGKRIPIIKVQCQ
jgi:hypothetical protein